MATYLSIHSTISAPYQSDNPQETQALLMALLASSRSVNAAKTALPRLGLSGSEQDIDSFAHEFIEELQLHSSRPLDPDLLTLFLDAKYIEVKEADRLRRCAIYIVVGLGRASSWRNTKLKTSTV